MSHSDSQVKSPQGFILWFQFHFFLPLVALGGHFHFFLLPAYPDTSWIKRRPSRSFFTKCNLASINMNPFSNSSRSQWVLLVDFMYTILGRRLHVLGKNFSIGWIAHLTRLRCFPGFLCLRSNHAAFTSPKESPK